MTVVPHFLTLGFVCPLILVFNRLEVTYAVFQIFLFLVPSVILVTFSHRRIFIFFPPSRSLLLSLQHICITLICASNSRYTVLVFMGQFCTELRIP